MNREGSSQKAVGRKTSAVWVVVLALWVTANVHAQTGLAKPVGAEAGLTITLRVYNYARIATALLCRSEEEATAIFRQAGVEAVWVDCPLSGAELDRFPACQQPMGRTDFALRILSPSMTQKAPVGSEALGFTLPCPDNVAGCYADVFYRRVADWAADWQISAYQLLGHAMAHEIGHLLLGPNSHSRAGIMRPQWNLNDLKDMAQTSLRFTPEQTAGIRAAVLARTRQPKVTQLQTR